LLGTYGAAEELTIADDCLDCDEKFYCPMFGTTESTKDDFPCADGYICDAGSTSATGSNTCPIDNYCVAGD